MVLAVASCVDLVGAIACFSLVGLDGAARRPAGAPVGGGRVVFRLKNKYETQESSF
jgi:hypothetical protein